MLVRRQVTTQHKNTFSRAFYSLELNRTDVSKGAAKCFDLAFMTASSSAQLQLALSANRHGHPTKTTV